MDIAMVKQEQFSDLEANNQLNLDPQDPRPIIESTFIKYEHSYDEDLMLQLETEKSKNDKLFYSLEIANANLGRAKDHLENVKRLNHKLEQDLEMQIIQTKNLKSINMKFIRTINNLQSYKEYVASLLAKKSRTGDRITRLIKTIKHMQNIIKSKNAIIAKTGRNYDVVLQKAARIIKESYSI